ncbi:hypothetical protein LINPERPRIM_LOCUS5588 [Linum perenne]
MYCLAGWEGSTHDARVLRDALCRPNGLKVPKGNQTIQTFPFINFVLDIYLIILTVFH